jgi:hypothetical protein
MVDHSELGLLVQRISDEGGLICCTDEGHAAGVTDPVGQVA